MRINKYIASCGYSSRRKADELIQMGKVKVNNQIVTDFSYDVKASDEVKVNNQLIFLSAKEYYIFYKPASCITTMKDEFDRKTIYDYLPASIKANRIFPVGRLDFDTTGVLLLTNDGDFMNQLTGPNSGIEKEYLVRCEGIITKDELLPFYKGYKLNGRKLLPARFLIDSIDKTHNSSLVYLTITEGLNHQVKEMFSSINHPVKKLKRVRFGSITLGGLKIGEYRKLSISEIHDLKVLARENKNMRLRKHD